MPVELIRGHHIADKQQQLAQCAVHAIEISSFNGLHEVYSTSSQIHCTVFLDFHPFNIVLFQLFLCFILVLQPHMLSADLQYIPCDNFTVTSIYFLAFVKRRLNVVKWRACFMSEYMLLSANLLKSSSRYLKR